MRSAMVSRTNKSSRTRRRPQRRIRNSFGRADKTSQVAKLKKAKKKRVKHPAPDVKADAVKAVDKIYFHQSKAHPLRNSKFEDLPATDNFKELTRYQRIADPYVEKDDGKYKLDPGLPAQQPGQLKQEVCCSGVVFNAKTNSVHLKGFRGTPGQVARGHAYMCGYHGSGKNKQPITQGMVEFNEAAGKFIRIPRSNQSLEQVKAWRKKHEVKIKRIMSKRKITDSLGRVLEFDEVYPYHFKKEDGLRDPPKAKPRKKTEQEIKEARDARNAIRKRETKRRNAAIKAAKARRREEKKRMRESEKQEKKRMRESKKERESKKTMSIDNLVT